MKVFFRNNPYNFYLNRFIFDREGAKNKLAQFFLRHGVFLALDDAPNFNFQSKHTALQKFSHSLSDYSLLTFSILHFAMMTAP